MPRNPSELARLEAEREELIQSIFHSKFSRPKGVKESMLRDLRYIELMLGIKGDNYNES